MDERAELGRAGEDLAVQHLERAGLTVLDRNWRCREGELDVVARSGGTVVFVEVKTRRGTAFGAPEEAVTRAKARRLRLLACRWLVEHRPSGADALRFDVVSVLTRRGVAPEVVHLRDAF